VSSNYIYFYIEFLSKINTSSSTSYSSFIKNKEFDSNKNENENESSIDNMSKSDRIYYDSTPKTNVKDIYAIENKMKPSYVYKDDQKNLNLNFVNNKIINKNSKINKNIDFIEYNSIKVPKNNILIKINNKKSKNSELYGRNMNLKDMKSSPPREPELYLHVYNLNNKNSLLKNNETVGILNKGNIPNVYFNHLMIDEKYLIFNNRCKFNRLSLTQRNKNKLLTIIYYSR